jgi:heme a synthase
MRRHSGRFRRSQTDLKLRFAMPIVKFAGLGRTRCQQSRTLCLLGCASLQWKVFRALMHADQSQSSRGLYRFAVATSCCTILLLMAGALVTSNNAADSVPDWPLAYGKLIPPLIGGIRFEYTHRVLAGIVSILTLVLAIWITAAERRPLAKRLGWTAVVLVLAQAALGGFRVLEGYPSISATAHATLAQIFFIVVVGLSLYLSPWWQSEHTPLEDRGSPRLRPLAMWMTASVLVQLILGAAFRHGAFGIVPHLVGAGVVMAFVVWAGVTAKRRFREVRDLRRAAILLHACLGTQLLLGGAAWWAVTAAAEAVQPVFLYVILEVAHVLGGALTLAAAVIFTLACFRLIPSAASVTANSQAPEHAPGRARA